MDTICAIARQRGLHVVEDCAQAAGGRYRHRRLGLLAISAASAFILPRTWARSGDGGMIVTSNATLASAVRRLREYGWDATRRTREIGLNSRLAPIQAAILAAKLPYLDEENSRRAALAERYAEGLAELPIALPATRPEANHVYHLYVVSCDERDVLMTYLTKCGVGCGIHYPVAVHQQRGYADHVKIPKAGLPITEACTPRRYFASDVS